MRPGDIEADVKEMERRKRVEAIMQSQVRRSFLKFSFNNSCSISAFSGRTGASCWRFLARHWV